MSATSPSCSQVRCSRPPLTRRSSPYRFASGGVGSASADPLAAEAAPAPVDAEVTRAALAPPWRRAERRAFPGPGRRPVQPEPLELLGRPARLQRLMCASASSRSSSASAACCSRRSCAMRSRASPVRWRSAASWGAAATRLSSNSAPPLRWPGCQRRQAWREAHGTAALRAATSTCARLDAAPEV